MATRLDWTTDTNEWPDLAPVLSSGYYLIYRSEDGKEYATIYDGSYLHIGTLDDCQRAAEQHAVVELAK